jgi:RimJ/RimL family protein N-acetyltransferase
VQIRRVPFREGSDAELTALHRVEIPVEAERGTNRMPHDLDLYISYARSLPAQFDDHSWLAEDDDGPVAVGVCWSNAAGDPNVMELDVLVLPEHRRRGIATQLLRLICDETVAEGRGLLVWSTFSAVPAGEALSKALGARPARVNRTSELVLADVDWALVDAWSRPADGYELQVIDGPLPVELHDDAAHFHHIMQTQPHDDLDVGDAFITAAQVADLDRALYEAGRHKWTAFVRDRDGRCVGGTELLFEPGQEAVALQQNTGIDPDHRGNGLAKLAKAALLQRLRTDAPRVERVRTSNAFSNDAMLAINDALGFRVTATRTEWQAEPDAVLRALGRPSRRAAG